MLDITPPARCRTVVVALGIGAVFVSAVFLGASPGQIGEPGEVPGDGLFMAGRALRVGGYVVGGFATSGAFLLLVHGAPRN
jgi:hypothetical protein